MEDSQKDSWANVHWGVFYLTNLRLWMVMSSRSSERRQGKKYFSLCLSGLAQEGCHWWESSRTPFQSSCPGRVTLEQQG